MSDPPPDPRTAVIELRHELAGLEALAETVERFTERHRLAREVGAKLNLALEEVVTNIFSYGFGAGATPWIRVGLAFDGRKLTARVEDNGIPFDPLRAEVPPIDVPIDERRIGGLGIRLVRALMDDVQYSREQDRNVLTLHKTLPEGRALQ